MTPLLFEILDAIRADVQALDLPGLSAANVVVQKVAGDRAADLPAAKHPCILIAPSGAESLDAAAGTNLRDDVVYPVRVTIVAPDSRNQEERLQQYLGWRETIRRSFHNQRLTASLCFTVRVQPLEIVDRSAWSDKSLFVSSLVLHCYAREPRG
ncbi:MAG: hypothetical protein ACT4QC_22150 [Planctomycetaceae bacterium]